MGSLFDFVFGIDSIDNGNNAINEDDDFLPLPSMLHSRAYPVMTRMGLFDSAPSRLQAETPVHLSELTGAMPITFPSFRYTGAFAAYVSKALVSAETAPIKRQLSSDTCWICMELCSVADSSTCRSCTDVAHAACLDAMRRESGEVCACKACLDEYKARASAKRPSWMRWMRRADAIPVSYKWMGSVVHNGTIRVDRAGEVIRSKVFKHLGLATHTHMTMSLCGRQVEGLSLDQFAALAVARNACKKAHVMIVGI